MNFSKITVRYAKAIFLLSKEKNITDALKEDMLLISKVLDDVPELGFLLGNPTIKPSSKEKALHLIFDKKVKEETFTLLQLIIKNKREEYIKNIARYFIDLYRKDKGIKSVTLTTAFEPSDVLTKELVKLIKDIYKSEIELQTRIREDIIGGFIVSVDDLQLDASVIKKLKDYEKDFINTSFEYKILG